MSFEEFQNQSRLYVIGALEPEETGRIRRERAKFGKKAEDFITECYGLHEAFALSSAAGEVFCRNQGAAYGDGASTEGSLN